MVLSLVWYVFVGLFFYRKEISGLFGGDGIGGLTDRPLPHRWGSGVEEVAELEASENPSPGSKVLGDSLVGKSKLPEGMSVVSASEVSFAGDADGDKVMKIGLVADVVQDIKEVFALLAGENGEKKDFLFLMEEISERYPGIGSFPSLGKINAFIREHAPFHISNEELEHVWG